MLTDERQYDCQEGCGRKGLVCQLNVRLEGMHKLSHEDEHLMVAVPVGRGLLVSANPCQALIYLSSIEMDKVKTSMMKAAAMYEALVIQMLTNR